MAGKPKYGGTLSAVVIVDPADLGGEVRMLIDGNTFVLRGGIVRGLRELTLRRSHEDKMAIVRAVLR